MLTKIELTNLLTTEYQTTKKVIMAMPADKLDFAPHEKSTPAGKLIRVFGAGMAITLSILNNQEVTDPYNNVPEIDSLADAEKMFDELSAQMLQKVSELSDEGLNQTVTVWGMTKTYSEWILFLLLDMIHHRGQLSVYIRLAGGLVPSIYGPSADDRGEA